MEDTIYYTFSTIAQVLAAVFGLTAIFIIFFNQNIKQGILGYSQSIYDLFSEIGRQDMESYYKNSFKRILLSQNIDEIYNSLDSMKSFIKGIDNDEVIDRFDLCKNGIEIYFTIMEDRDKIFARISYFTLGIIILSISMLIGAKYLESNYAIILVILFSLLSIFNIYVIVNFVLTALQRK